MFLEYFSRNILWDYVRRMFAEYLMVTFAEHSARECSRMFGVCWDIGPTLGHGHSYGWRMVCFTMGRCLFEMRSNVRCNGNGPMTLAQCHFTIPRYSRRILTGLSQVRAGTSQSTSQVRASTGIDGNWWTRLLLTGLTHIYHFTGYIHKGFMLHM